MSDELVAWLRAQLDDDERVALAATPEAWITANRCVEVAGRRMVASVVPYVPQVTDAEHIARWDPARVLQEVEAKRLILDLYVEAVEFERRPDSAFPGVPFAGREYLDPVIGFLALPYSDRPGYRQEWAPS